MLLYNLPIRQNAAVFDNEVTILLDIDQPKAPVPFPHRDSNPAINPTSIRNSMLSDMFPKCSEPYVPKSNGNDHMPPMTSPC